MIVLLLVMEKLEKRNTKVKVIFTLEISYKIIFEHKNDVEKFRNQKNFVTKDIILTHLYNEKYL